MDSHGFFTLTELQERLNLADRQSLLQALQDAEVPYSRLGRETFFTNESFVKWLSDHAQTGKPIRQKPKPNKAEL